MKQSHGGSAGVRRTRTIKVPGSIPAPVKKPAPLKHEFVFTGVSVVRNPSSWGGSVLQLSIVSSLTNSLPWSLNTHVLWHNGVLHCDPRPIKEKKNNNNNKYENINFFYIYDSQKLVCTLEKVKLFYVE